MSLTFIDPLSENFAYLSPVIYCPSCAQLVFNTLPGALHSSSLNTMERGCHGGQYFIAGPCQDRRLPATAERGGPTRRCFRPQVPEVPCLWARAEQKGPGLSFSFCFFFKAARAPIPPFSTETRQRSAQPVPAAERKHLQAKPPAGEMSFLCSLPTVARPLFASWWKILSIQVPDSHSRRFVPQKEDQRTYADAASQTQIPKDNRVLGPGRGGGGSRY